MFLLPRSTEAAPLAATFRRLAELPETAATIDAARTLLRGLFTTPAGAGIGLPRAAVAGIEDEDIVAQSCIALVTDLRDALT